MIRSPTRRGFVVEQVCPAETDFEIVCTKVWVERGPLPLQSPIAQMWSTFGFSIGHQR